MLVAIKTGVKPVAELVSVCSDSDYNQPAMICKRRTQNATPNNA